MNAGLLLLFALNFGFIGALPVIFFRRDGKLNFRWFLTAAPYFAAPAVLLLVHFGVLPAWPAVPAFIQFWLELASVPFAMGSIVLMALALGSHRIPIALWHQANDAPREIVTWGPYKRIRHPFYASFLLALAGATVFCPHPGTALLLLYGIVALSITAAREEGRLSKSAFGPQYQAYMRTTGRFVPRLGSVKL
jgi:protein-S-isoprenylcysteine O-methyltransferase Ste14